jgi:hypothetical protein
VSPAGDGHTRTKDAIEVEIHGLHGAADARCEVNEDIPRLNGTHAGLRILRAAAIAYKAFADIAEACRRSEGMANLAVEHGHHAHFWLSASAASHARRIALC